MVILLIIVSANQQLLTPLQTMQQFYENMDVRKKIYRNLRLANYIFDTGFETFMFEVL